MAKPSDSRYSKLTAIELDEWERRQIALWVEDAVVKTRTHAGNLRKITGNRVTGFEAERMERWLVDLLAKLQADSE